jgi:pantoate--beta-alanine ligase
VIHRALGAAAELAASGERSPRVIVDRARLVLAGEPLFRTEYIELVGMDDLKPVPEEGPAGEALLLVAGRLGHTRLIDNMIVAVKA